MRRPIVALNIRRRLNDIATYAQFVHEWGYSQDGVTWASARPTRQAKTTISGLAAKSIEYFRFRSLGKEGLSD